jgi:hypothetical protein
MKELSECIERLSLSLKEYTRKDTQATEIIDVIKDLQNQAMKSIDIISTEYEIYLARYLFGIIICNYTTGSNTTNDKRTEEDLKNYLTVSSYKACLMFSEFIPLLWMTENIEEISMTSFTFTDEFIQKYIDDGELIKCLMNLSKYYQQYFWPKYNNDPSIIKNCELSKLPIIKSFDEIHKLVYTFVDNPEIKTWNDFFIQGRSILSKLDTHHIKMLPYMAQKKNFAFNGELMKIPETWPKYDRDIELYESILSVMNVCFASYGGDRDVEEHDSKSVKYYVPKNRGSYTYNDLGLYNKNSMYFDERAFVIIPNDKFTYSKQTSKCIKASELNVDVWKNVTLTLDANPNDAKSQSSNRQSMFNNTGYFTDRIFNCNDISEVSDRFPIIPGLSAYKPITNGQGNSTTFIKPEQQIKQYAHEQSSEKDSKNSSEKNSKDSIPTGILSRIKIGQPIEIDKQKYEINTIINDFYNEIRSDSKLAGFLYNSLNSKLYSSVDYITNDGMKYSRNPKVPYFIYYNLIPASLNFELLIPFSTLSTHMTLCSNDLKNGCNEQYLIPFVFSCPKNNGIISDPLFNINDINKL